MEQIVNEVFLLHFEVLEQTNSISPGNHSNGAKTESHLRRIFLLRWRERDATYDCDCVTVSRSTGTGQPVLSLAGTVRNVRSEMLSQRFLKQEEGRVYVSVWLDEGRRKQHLWNWCLKR